MADPAVFDVLVIGAGPAGSATARWLAGRGARVAVVERTRFDTARIGESLAPDVQAPLRELGLWPEFMATAPMPSWGTRSVWGSDQPQSHSHLVTAYGCGWHIDRRAFDRMLARGAEAAGATLYQGFTGYRAVHERGAWHLQTGRPDALRGRVLVDATGRRARFARSAGARRLTFDRLVGVAAHFGDIVPAEQGHLLVEATLDGWWYSAPLPAGARTDPRSLITMLMTDADVCAGNGLAHAQAWHGALARTVATRQRTAGAKPTSTPTVHCAMSQRTRREPACETGPWLAVGDAALVVDPVSGSGVLRALRGARAAAETIGNFLDNFSAWREPLAAYEHDRDEEFTSYLVERAQYYGFERRFATPFWQRRRMVHSEVLDAP